MNRIHRVQERRKKKEKHTPGQKHKDGEKKSPPPQTLGERFIEEKTHRDPSSTITRKSLVDTVEGPNDDTAQST
jgi:hypothetical protein